MALVLAALVFLITIVLTILIIGADEMSDAVGTTTSPVPVFLSGTVISGLIALSHWVHMTW